ncbi:MAG: DUF1501 domain-containing protein [Bacteroidetes bacterium]|jgi:uncharacterized protein (DUF1501 family)|nr:DUF1501 domain-containing protein [Bacteroidota bacterium]
MSEAHTPDPTPRYGSRLAHGEAHAHDHACWSRRDFLTTLGLATVGSSFVIGGTPVRAFGQSALLRRLQTVETDRVLVLIQLGGGNDGLNTVVPVDDDRYYNNRPTLALPKNDTLRLDDGVGLHPSFDALTPVYGDGDMAVLQNVGYPTPNLSHFRSTDIWLSASDSNEVLSTGWVGRYLDQSFPDFSEEPTDFPLAVQVGGLGSMLFQGPAANMGMSLTTPDIYEQIASEGILFRTDDLPQTTYGSEMEFVRSVANGAFVYAEAVQEAAQSGQNRVDYPTPNPLATNLAIVAQQIKGRLGARIYHVNLSGFDTHSNQEGTHALLLRYLAEAVDAFLRDLAADDLAEDVLVMTFSEFGRRVQENGSQGTDHGTAAPLFLFGNGVEGGLYGSVPDLSNLDGTGNIPFETDFRQVYATVLRDWFGLTAEETTSVLGDAFEPLPVVTDPAGGDPTDTQPPAVPEAFALYQNYPNPFNPRTTITYTLSAAAPVTLRIYDAQGRLVQTLVQGTRPAGPHAVRFDAGHLPSGTYFYRLETPEGQKTRQMALVR